MTDYDFWRVRMSTAPQGPAEPVVEVWHQYCIQHRRHPQSADDARVFGQRSPDDEWFTTWAGDRHRGDDPSESERHLLLLHKARDRGYPHEHVFAGTRMLCRIETASVEVTPVTAVWEESHV